MSGVCDLNAKELIILASIVTLAFSENKTIDELNVLGNFLVTVGTNFLAIAAIEDANKNSLNNKESKNNNIKKEEFDKSTSTSDNCTD
ncbi:hypothetical protein HAHI6034_11680 [Hathewaya histolytica]|uniref:Uncharacterized protein n=1 Tax=Hathewaya histolytica TaxID=1498 RepID=A0A4U9RBD9_HATHI|nr:hypothetical protein [Hathewaya histolytica]VTQ89025.1 Uncharacterised protein [Hathewaya histolytica]